MAGRIARNAVWTVLGQVAPMGITIFLTPYIIHGLGVTRYGLFVLIGSLVTFLGTFDGGTTATAQRYFGIYAGSGDRKAATELLSTSLVALFVLGVIVSSVGWLVAPPIVDLLRMPANLRPQAVFLFRTLGILVTFSLFHGAFAGILQAHSRYAYLTKIGFGCYGLWAVGLFLTVHFDWGLRGIAFVFLSQQLLLTVTAIPASLRYVDRRHVGFLSRSESRAFLRFASRSQLNGLSTIVNTEFDNLIIGGIRSVRTVSFYQAGTNLAQNIGGVVLSVLFPAQTALANTYGRSGEEAAFSQFKRLQHLWVTVLTGWFAAAMGAAYFAIIAWLGSGFRLAAVIAIIALATQMLALLGPVLAYYCGVVGQPGASSLANIVSVVANVAFTIPLLLTGAIGVAAGTCGGQLVGLIALIVLARRRVSADIPNMLRSVAIVPGLATVAVVVGLELLARPIMPTGGLGLMVAGVPAGVGLAVFAVLLFGPRQCVVFGQTLVRQSRSEGPRAAVFALVRSMMDII